MGSSEIKGIILKIVAKEREEFLRECARIVIESALRREKTVSQEARFKILNQRLQEIYLLYKATKRPAQHVRSQVKGTGHP